MILYTADKTSDKIIKLHIGLKQSVFAERVKAGQKASKVIADSLMSQAYVTDFEELNNIKKENATKIAFTRKQACLVKGSL